MLYLPPYYYHSVRGGPTGSISANVWVPSAAQKVKQLIAKSTPMPFSSGDRFEAKALKLATASALIFDKIGVVQGKSTNKKRKKKVMGKGKAADTAASEAAAAVAEATATMARLMRDRHSPPLEEESESVTGLALREFCQSVAAAPSSNDGEIKASADAVASLLVAELKDPMVRLHVLLDVVDELFDTVVDIFTEVKGPLSDLNGECCSNKIVP